MSSLDVCARAFFALDDHHHHHHPKMNRRRVSSSSSSSSSSFIQRLLFGLGHLVSVVSTLSEREKRNDARSRSLSISAFQKKSICLGFVNLGF